MGPSPMYGKKHGLLLECEWGYTMKSVTNVDGEWTDGLGALTFEVLGVPYPRQNERVHRDGTSCPERCIHDGLFIGNLFITSNIVIID